MACSTVLMCTSPSYMYMYSITSTGTSSSEGISSGLASLPPSLLSSSSFSSSSLLLSEGSSTISPLSRALCRCSSYRFLIALALISAKPESQSDKKTVEERQMGNGGRGAKRGSGKKRETARGKGEGGCRKREFSFKKRGTSRSKVMSMSFLHEHVPFTLSIILFRSLSFQRCLSSCSASLPPRSLHIHVCTYMSMPMYMGECKGTCTVTNITHVHDKWT